MGKDRWDMFDPARHAQFMEFYAELMDFQPFPFAQEEGIEETALIVLVISAMVRDDPATFSWALDSGLDLGKLSMRLLLKGIWLVPKLASAEIATMIVERNRRFKIQNFKRFGKFYEVLENAASTGNVDALGVWIEYLKREGDEHLQWNLAYNMRGAAMKGDFAMVEFLDRWFEGDTSALLYNILIKALDAENVSAMAALLEYRGFDRDMSTKKFPTGPIFTALMRQRHDSPLVLLETLLKGGVDPDGRYPGVMGTPLQRAVEEGDLDQASLLIKYGADVNVSCTPHRMRQRSPVPLLIVAARKRKDEMVRLLLDNSADPTSVQKERKHAVYIQCLLDGKAPEKSDSDKAWSKAFKKLGV